MPTITAIALDSLIEPGATKSMAPVRNSSYSNLERRHSTPNSRLDSVKNAPGAKMERGVSVPPNPKLERNFGVSPNVKRETGVYIPYNLKLDRRNCESTTSVTDDKHHWTQISPALYATPESTPLPDSPSSFPPSPYIINHKRRGPRLMKSFSEDDVARCESATNENGNSTEKEIASVAKDDSSVPGEMVDCMRDDNFISSIPAGAKGKNVKDVWNYERGNSNIANGSAGPNDVMMCASFNLQQDGEGDDFVDPQESMSIKSNSESEGYGRAERSLNPTTPISEFYDAWEELSSESGPQLPMQGIENELREIRLSLLMEIEKRKQAEETLNNMRNEWQRICERLSLLGLTLPGDPTTLPEGEQPADPAAEVCQQVFLTRFVSNSIGRGTAKAEVEMEMEAQIRLKNFEIARLLDKLHYYETMNQEMSQRNQEVVETARRLRQKRKRRQRWVWGSIAAVITLGSAALGWSYFQTGKGSYNSNQLHAPEVDYEPE